VKRSAEVSLFWGTHCIAHRSVHVKGALTLGDVSVSFRHGDLHVHPPLGPAFVLAPRESVALAVDAFTFVIHAAELEELPPMPLGKRVEESAVPAVLGSALAHLACFAALTFLMPTLGPTDAEALDRDQLDAMARYLASAAERETEPPIEAVKTVFEEGDDTPARTGRRPKDTAGALANPDPTDAHDRRSVAGHDRVSDGSLARERELALAAEFGMVALVTATEEGHDAPRSPWGATLAGADKESHLGNLWGADLGDAFGNGLDLSGTGDGVGGRGRGVDRDGLGLSGTGYGGTCDDTCEGGRLGHGGGTGYGRTRPREHAPKVPTMRGSPTISGDGRLDPRIIQRIVRQNHGRFLACYQDALQGNPTLQGRVSVLFVIGRDGAVSLAEDSTGSDLPDREVTKCIVRRFYDLGFPAPTGGTVHVVYPLVLTPAE